MNQKDWVEYFEAMNGRKPTASEFSEALKRNEFVTENGNQRLRGVRIFGILFGILAIVAMGIIYWNNSLVSTFDVDNFESGKWVMMEYQDGGGNYQVGTWKELYNVESLEDIQYRKFDDYNKFVKKFKGSEISVLSKKELWSSIQDIVGEDKKIRENNFTIVTTEEVSIIYYWIDRNTAIMYHPSFATKFQVVRKISQNKGITGDYEFFDVKSLSDNSYNEDEFESLKGMVVTFDGTKIADLEGNALMSYDDFSELYKSSRHDLNQIRNLASINRQIKQAGYKVGSADNVYVGINAEESLTSAFIFIPVENGKKVLMLSLVPAESDYLEGTSEDAIESYNSVMVLKRVKLKNE